MRGPVVTVVQVAFAMFVVAPAISVPYAPLQAQERLDLASLGYDRGEPEAPIRIVEFADFGCPACAEFATETWADFRKEFIDTGLVTWKFIPFVLGTFRNSREATRAAECVADLAPHSFWAMHDLLYERQTHWNRRRRPKEQFRELAVEAGLDGEAFEDCYGAKSSEARTRRNNQAAKESGVRVTPTFFVDGQPVVGALPLDAWRELLEEIQKQGAG